ncbi:GAF and ANTAR domain-containing protein [Kribbella sp. CA-294648]|uniref:GAF and ANTAR domain-containing protein n=1 Tax=Kribbella sp. CA-294648 TaxID=3239948 RepID=UPI003D93A83A
MNGRLDTPMPERVVRELAAAAAALVTDHDVLGTVTNLLAGCERCLGATGSGIVVSRPDDQRLEFLAATSHRAEDIELYQAQTEQGPAADSIASGEPVSIGGPRFVERWPGLAEQAKARGFKSIYAHPLRWRGQTLGALNLFFAGDEAPAGTEPVAQAFSDLATVVIVHSGSVSITHVIGQLRNALSDRVLIEQAKGVLAYTENLTIDTAFGRLLTMSAESGRPLSEVASDIVENLAHPHSP